MGGRMLMKLNWIVAALSVSLLIQNVPQLHAAKILVVVFPQPSHVIAKLGIAADLVSQGHEIHIALPTGYPHKEAVTRAGIKIVQYRQLPEVMYPFTAQYEDEMNNLIYNRNTTDLDIVWPICQDNCRTIMEDTDFISRVTEANYSLVLVEPFIVNPCYLIIPYKLGIPFVSIAAGVVPLAFRLPALPSFYPQLHPGTEVMNVPTMLTFGERLSGALKTALFRLVALSYLWGDTTLLHRYAPGIDSWEQLMLKSEIVLVENDHTLDNFMPLLPHVVTIAGCSAQPAKPLPESIEKIMAQSGDDGVILASFGTSAYRMPSNIATKFLEAFGRLRQTVLTKMAVPPGVTVPDNVHMLPWLPQNDILGHPKMKLFITHCGSNGQYEAVYHGVPMLGIPMFAEQGWNCARARNKGISLCLDLLEFTADELHDTIQELVDNATYRSNIRKLSQIFRDEPMDGCKKAAFWINHVIKYGSSHLRSPALDQPLYQFLMFDVAGIVIIVILAAIAAVYLTCIWLLNKRKYKGRKNKKD